jgi:DNA-binding SARP family transcriptional activator/tetratricopeptide (TPR) repeat protein
LDFRLETFGGLTLVGHDRTAGAHQKRRLALLALLAVSGDRGQTRDQLIAYLWPEKPADSGRHSLEQLLYAMRQALGNSVFDGGDPLRLNDRIIASDVTEFERGFANGALADACTLYRGPFLDGFYLGNGSEFEPWAETTRARLSLQHQSGLLRLAQEATAGGNTADAVRWWRALSAADPVSGRAALGLMTALVAASDRAAALRHFRVHEQIVRGQLDIAPDEQVIAFAAELRSARPTSSRRETGAMAEPGPASDDGDPTPETAGDVQPHSAPHGEPAIEQRHLVTLGSSGRAVRLAGFVFGTIAVAALTAVVLLQVRNPDSPALDRSKVAVVPFRFSGPDSQRYLQEAIPQLFAQEFTGEGGPEAIDPGVSINASNRIASSRNGPSLDDERQAARDVGAARVLGGTITWLPDGTLSVSATLRSVDSGQPDARATTQQPADSLTALVRHLAIQLLALDAGIAEQRLAGLGSRSPPAVRAFLEGRAAHIRGHHEDAIERFGRALDFDSTFALAALDLALSTNRLLALRAWGPGESRVYSILPGFRSGGPAKELDLFDRAVKLAWSYRDQLSARDRPLLDIVRGDTLSSRDKLNSLERALSAAPDRAETYYLLGTLLLHQGRALEVDDSRALSARAFSRALQLDETYVAPLAGLVDRAFLDGEAAELRRLGRLYLARDSSGPGAEFVEWSVAVGTGDAAAHGAFRARFGSLNTETLFRIWTASQMTGQALEDADLAVSQLSRNAVSPVEASGALFREYHDAMNRGRVGAALDILRRRRDRSRESFTEESFWQSVLHAGLSDDAYSQEASESARNWRGKIERDTLRGPPHDADSLLWVSRGVFLLANWELLHGDTMRARSSIAWLRSRDAQQALMVEALWAAVAQRAGADSLLGRVTELSLRGCCTGPWPGNNLILARAYERIGRNDEALRAVRRGLWVYPPRYVAAYRREEGRLAARTGDVAGAIQAYRHYLALRSDPDDRLRRERDDIRGELARLER